MTTGNHSRYVGQSLRRREDRRLLLGESRYVGDLSSVLVGSPIVDAVPTATGRGYWLVGSDGPYVAALDPRVEQRVDALWSSLLRSPGPDLDQ